ncbi:hypothetical protein G7K_6576-t1 [Saitoella complicata NRRL Y-17804]|uniref:Uncharacterized protein n=1 Tax=Saitoella complicata (strain BCRC 22490 / CBS 7301 / JCM 7358 / NBRC 10748 / NRRL Y-17804) TaxID=698492 RepID=A0A0E9NS71_SAICN|nr:hypothetical protein G7K_6576-t1 [Saitoella complicata NRRL Y-17804]
MSTKRAGTMFSVTQNKMSKAVDRRLDDNGNPLALSSLPRNVATRLPATRLDQTQEENNNNTNQPQPVSQTSPGEGYQLQERKDVTKTASTVTLPPTSTTWTAAHPCDRPTINKHPTSVSSKLRQHNTITASLFTPSFSDTI